MNRSRPRQSKRNKTALAVAFCAAALIGARAEATEAANAADAALIKDKLPLCAGCHTETGNSVIPQNPKLAGQNAEYLEKELKEWKDSSRKSEIMGPIASTLSDQEMAALARYFARQKPAPGVSGNPQWVAAGKQIYDDGIEAKGVPACAGCHDENGAGSDAYPRLAGQHPAYAIDQMLKFKSGARANDRRQVMRSVTKRMTEDEIRAVAEYMTTLTGGQP
jgi:cytochrome c553